MLYFSFFSPEIALGFLFLFILCDQLVCRVRPAICCVRPDDLVVRPVDFSFFVVRTDLSRATNTFTGLRPDCCATSHHFFIYFVGYAQCGLDIGSFVANSRPLLGCVPHTSVFSVLTSSFLACSSLKHTRVWVAHTLIIVSHRGRSSPCSTLLLVCSLPRSPLIIRSHDPHSSGRST